MSKQSTNQKTYAGLKKYFEDQPDGLYDVDIAGSKPRNLFFSNNFQTRKNLQDHFSDFLYEEDAIAIESTQLQANVNNVPKQFFKEGETNCLFTPIIDFCQKYIDNPEKLKKTKETYITLRNKAKKMINEYTDGISQDQKEIDSIVKN